jgi:hypothetical protein
MPAIDRGTITFTGSTFDQIEGRRGGTFLYVPHADHHQYIKIQMHKGVKYLACRYRRSGCKARAKIASDSGVMTFSGVHNCDLETDPKVLRNRMKNQPVELIMQHNQGDYSM